jgi:serine/threonine protein kinase
MTESGAIVGTPMFMAPEQVLGGSAQAGTLCDVYSLGATLYALVTGQPPFDGPTAQSVLKAVLEPRPGAAEPLRHDLPVAVERSSAEGDGSRPGAARYGSALEFAEDLERIATQERGELLDAAEGVIGEEEPRDTHDFVVRARLLELRGDREASRRTILEATHRFPGDALAHAAAAELLRRLGFGAEGDVAAETARRIDPRVESAPAMESTPSEPGIDVLELQDFVDGVRGLVQRIEKKDE